MSYQGDHLLNSKEEYNRCAVPRLIAIKGKQDVLTLLGGKNLPSIMPDEDEVVSIMSKKRQRVQEDGRKQNKKRRITQNEQNPPTKAKLKKLPSATISSLPQKRKRYLEHEGSQEPQEAQHQKSRRTTAISQMHTH